MIKNSKKHLRDAEENYLQHMGAALKISSQLLIASLQALFHSIIPAFCTTSAFPGDFFLPERVYAKILSFFYTKNTFSI